MAKTIKRKKAFNTIKRIIRYTLLAIGSFLGTIIVAMLFLLYGPFTELHDLYVITVMETSAAKFLATAFLSDAEIEAVYRRNATIASEEESDPSLIKIVVTEATTETEPVETKVSYLPNGETETEASASSSQQQDPSQTEPPAVTPADLLYANHPDAMHETDGIDGLQLVQVSGPTYTGYMLVISDPNRVSLCVSSSILKCSKNGGEWWNSSRGERLSTMMNDQKAIAGINGGAFYDPNGNGNGGCPEGVLIYNGELLYWGPEAQKENNWESKKVNVIGINFDNIFILGQYTKEEVLKLNLRDAVSFDNPNPPFLVVNGKESAMIGSGGSGIQPRTCIGQRADGAFLFLVIDGRGAGGSLGATQKEATRLLIEFGAVNAANLDGGSSSELRINGETVSNPCSLIGPRYMPDGFIVK